MRTAKTLTGRMPRLIWVFTGPTCHFVGCVMSPLILLQCSKSWPIQGRANMLYNKPYVIVPLSHITRRPVHAIWEQQRCRSAWASTLSDQHFSFFSHCQDSIMCKHAKSKLTRLWLVSVAEQASLSLSWSQTPKDKFSHDVVWLSANLGLSFLEPISNIHMLCAQNMCLLCTSRVKGMIHNWGKRWILWWS